MSSYCSELAKYLVKSFYTDSHYAGVFIDVGAASPSYISSSRYFHDNGWKVIRVEPNPLWIAEYHKLGLQVEPFACSDYIQDNIDFELSNINQNLSFSCLAENKNYNCKKPVNYNPTTIKVNVRTLDWILQTSYPEINKIDVLAVDVEGSELEVIRGLNLAKYKPDIIASEDFLALHKADKYLKAMGYVYKTSVEHDYLYTRIGWR